MHKITSTTGVLVFAAIVIPIGALIEAWAASKLWAWFLSSPYGAGPSIGAWFGIMSIVDLVVRGMGRANSKQDDAGAQGMDAVGTLIGRWVTMGILLGMAFVTGSVFGWIR